MKLLIFLLFIAKSGIALCDVHKIAIKFDGSSTCSQQLKHFQEELGRNVLWARKMRDSWGNFPSGTFSGNLFDFGNFDQCIGFNHNSLVGEIIGQHCTLLIPFDRLSDESIAKFMPPSRNPESNIGIGACFPASCSPERVKEIADVFLAANYNTSTSPFYDQNAFCTTDIRPMESSTVLLVSSTAFFATTLLLVFLSTVYDVICTMKKFRKRWVLCSFSCYSNTKTIMSLSPSSSKEILFLHGIRSLSMISIVLGHTYMITFWFVPAINSHDLIEWIGDVSSQVVLVGFLGVDTFFLLSSLLLTLSVFRELDKTKKLNVPMLYVKRYFRITVPLAAAILFTISFLFHVGNGPLWTSMINGTAVDLCKEFWWTTLLFVGNYVNPGMLCFGHSWYLMADMQLYFLSPIVLYPFWLLRKRTAIVISLIFLIASSSVIFVFVTFLMEEFRVNFLSKLGPRREASVYTVTHGRIDSWMMGILVGFLMHKIEGKSVILPRSFVAIGWTLCFVVFAAVTFGQYPLQQENFKDNLLLADAFYDSLKRISWCLAISWVILACHFSYGGFVKQFLSLPIWLPISKLSFCIYLIHVPIQLIYLSSIRSPQFFSNFRAIYKFFGDFGVSFFVAFVWALMFEYPTLNMINILTKRRLQA